MGGITHFPERQKDKEKRLHTHVQYKRDEVPGPVGVLPRITPPPTILAVLLSRSRSEPRFFSWSRSRFKIWPEAEADMLAPAPWKLKRFKDVKFSFSSAASSHILCITNYTSCFSEPETAGAEIFWVEPEPIFLTRSWKKYLEPEPEPEKKWLGSTTLVQRREKWWFFCNNSSVIKRYIFLHLYQYNIMCIT